MLKGALNLLLLLLLWFSVSVSKRRHSFLSLYLPIFDNILSSYFPTQFSCHFFKISIYVTSPSTPPKVPLLLSVFPILSWCSSWFPPPSSPLLSSSLSTAPTEAAACPSPSSVHPPLFPPLPLSVPPLPPPRPPPAFRGCSTSDLRILETQLFQRRPAPRNCPLGYL